MPDRYKEDHKEICAVIGNAVFDLIKTGQALEVRNIILALQLKGAQTSSERLKNIYLLARHYVTQNAAKDNN
ncbi:hypothetical protein N5923_22630 [Erwiniaceae bacterium BAC15a-03b]|uniref:Fumarase D n=1 Tax=Winslowiella arboricola TaxID=2978220 RepID=A0A9J6Q213_9GAMM|nr:hypothetical protein [Winslowiella arboricola]MCU5775308.1 hypothetical protein [Winslowiella arboricola]MCU5780295.1 hypothetical protein [Winslowiella arboricola]